MTEFRIRQHPILPIPEQDEIEFFWQGQKLSAQRGETISSALFANGIRVFGHHPRDHSPQGLFCANGQCSQCMVIANGKPLKACMELVEEKMQVTPMEGLPDLPRVDHVPVMKTVQELEVPV
ncbi:(2Fe-2S)-binding protein, partial [bacterium]|nr:(2Fe-2S)-binding protein [bacterium]